jgi:hypothetical protein
MNWQLSHDYEVRLKRSEFKSIPADVEAFAKNTNSGFNSTGPTEDSFHYGKAFARSIAPQKPNGVQIWQVPVERQLLSKLLYDFTEIDMQDTTAFGEGDFGEEQSSLKSMELDDQFFMPRVATMSSKRLNKVKGKGKPTWPSHWPPERFHRVSEDTHMLLGADEGDGWQNADKQ